MKKVFKSNLLYLLKTIVILVLLLSLYYLLFLRPKIEKQKSINQVNVVLNIHKGNLTQNKLSFVQLANLDPISANFDLERSELVARLKESSKIGLEELDKNSQIPNINSKLSDRFPQILTETRRIYEDQGKILEKVFATNNFEEGVKIMKSDESIELLTRQTNLILEYEYWVKQLITYD